MIFPLVLVDLQQLLCPKEKANKMTTVALRINTLLTRNSLKRNSRASEPSLYDELLSFIVLWLCFCFIFNNFVWVCLSLVLFKIWSDYLCFLHLVWIKIYSNSNLNQRTFSLVCSHIWFSIYANRWRFRIITLVKFLIQPSLW